MVNEATTTNQEKLEDAKKQKRVKGDKMPKVENAQKTVEFPVESGVNGYGFIFMRKQWLAALGWGRGTPLKIDKNPDGSITIRKA